MLCKELIQTEVQTMVEPSAANVHIRTLQQLRNLALAQHQDVADVSPRLKTAAARLVKRGSAF